MATGPVFTQVWARCKEHGKLLEPNEVECDECKILRRNLALSPPFDVYCIDNYFAKFKKGQIYEVAIVIRDGATAYNNHNKGYCIANDDDSLYENILDALKFIPVQYLTPDNKDSWLEPDAS